MISCFTEEETEAKNKQNLWKGTQPKAVDGTGSQVRPGQSPHLNHSTMLPPRAQGEVSIHLPGCPAGPKLGQTRALHY